MRLQGITPLIYADPRPKPFRPFLGRPESALAHKRESGSPRWSDQRDRLFFVFAADPVTESRGWYDPHWHYDHESETRAAFERIFSDRLRAVRSRASPTDLRGALSHDDYYVHLPDLGTYRNADRRLVDG